MAEEITFTEQVLGRLAAILGIPEGWGRDSALATALGIEKNALSAWKRRDSIQYDIVISAASGAGANLHWLFLGEGSMLASDPYAIPDLETAGMVAERLAEYIKGIKPERKPLVGEGDFELIDDRDVGLDEGRDIGELVEGAKFERKGSGLVKSGMEEGQKKPKDREKARSK